jgi:hypothetical protein
MCNDGAVGSQAVLWISRSPILATNEQLTCKEFESIIRHYSSDFFFFFFFEYGF